MWDFSLSKSFGLMFKTAPFVVLRLVVYFGIALAFVLITGVGAGVGWGIGAMGEADFQATSTAYGGVFGLIAASAILYFIREYILYMVKAGHIAVLVELIDGRPLPAGRAQIDHATAIVKQRFMAANVLFGVDQLIKGVIRAITGIMEGIVSLIPIPALRNLVGIFKVFLQVSVGFLDEIILAHAIRTKAENPWASAQEALVLYAQNGKHMLKNAAWLAVMMYGLTFIIFLLMLAPAAGIAYLIPGAWSAGGFVVAIIFAIAAHKALIEPLAVACMMQVYFKAIEGQTPDPTWDARLTKLTKKFKKLKDKAVGWINPDPTPEPAAGPNEN
ncbi:MAG: hypothetical protein WD046_13515 [Paracoccaceae bacterium]